MAKNENDKIEEMENEIDRLNQEWRDKKEIKEVKKEVIKKDIPKMVRLYKHFMR
jgi:hypothetical protein